MISYSGFDNPHPRTCTCPRCGCVHGGATVVIIRVSMLELPELRDDDFRRMMEQLRVEAENMRYRAIGRSRELARLPDAPQRRPRMAQPRNDARMVHARRCATRRPRMSLRERVVSSLACRRPSH